MKTRSLKDGKMDIFPKGLTHGFGPKMDIFQTFVFIQYRRRKCFLRYSKTKITPFQAITTRSSKSWTIDIFPKELTHGFGPKMEIFPNFFLVKIGQENFFYEILERNNAFLSHKNNKFKKSKNWHFSRVVTPWFLSKNVRFSKFFF